MGSPPTEKGRYDDESPQHRVTIARPFAVSKYELSFAEWDACVASGDCEPRANNIQGQQPATNITIEDAEHYVAWLSRMTGKPYRMLTEAEYEYAARAGTQTTYPWGNEIEKNKADCAGCGSQWDGKQPAPVGSFAPNNFGLYDMVGNVWEWVEDCYHPNYDGAPLDGSVWRGADCDHRIARGGAWDSNPRYVRSAQRGLLTSDLRMSGLSFRIARTLLAP
jgi:formylglycine-generating enzyme required for sulfatase activity